MRKKKYKIIGKYIQEFNDLTGLSLPCIDISQWMGLKKHIRQRHPELLDKLHLIPNIIKEPDYVGSDRTKPNSIELIKRIEDNYLVAVTLDTNNQYLYVSSFYNINETKISRRMRSGRIKPFNAKKLYKGD